MAPIQTQLRFLLRYAILAPSTRNTQPWRFTVTGNVVELYADLDLQLPVADPEARELYLSLGCALENLLVAAEHFGFRHEVTYNPACVAGAPAASVAIAPGGHRSPARAGITLDALVRRHNDAGIYRATPLADDLRTRLQACRVEPDLRLYLLDDHFARRWVDQLTLEADRREFASPEYRAELAAWIGRGAFGGPALVSRLTQLAVSRLDLGEAIASQDRKRLQSAAAIGVIAGLDDSRLSHLRSGQLFERVWLTATELNLGLQPVSPVMQVPEVRAAIAELLPERGMTPYHLFRLGFSGVAQADAHHTPRRALEDVVEPGGSEDRA
jgi:hypothetical protein